MIDDSTIVAPATGSGGTAIGIIRVSGPQSRFIAETISGRLPRPRFAALRDFRDRNGVKLDEGLVFWFPAPHSFTGEDMAEFQIHGGRATIQVVLQTILKAGARLAEPGEFTRRAVLNGKMNLAEAEGLADLIAAETEAQRRQAIRQKEGLLGRQADQWRNDLLDLAALIEAELDFSDEGDVAEIARPDLLARVDRLHQSLQAALADGHRGERLRDGYRVVLAGPPNAGKSSLLNALAQRDAAIVSPQPGTTRDTIEVRLDLDGLPVILVDTAGIRDSDDAIEQEGIFRSLRQMETGDLVLWLQATDAIAGAEAPAGAIRVGTKADLGFSAGETLAVSAITGQGLDHLLDSISKHFHHYATGDALITRTRHREAISQAMHQLGAILRNEPLPLELLAEEVRLAARSLGAITGATQAEHVLDRIFSSFCIGK